MSTLYQQWQNIAYDETADRSQLEKFWGTYFQIEKEIYEKLLSNPDEVVKGTVKTIVGFLVLTAGSSFLQTGSLNDFGVIFNYAFNMQGVVPNNEAIVSLGLADFASDTAYIMCIGMIANIVLARFSRLHYIFLTGHHTLYMSAMLAIILNVGNLTGPMLWISGGLILGLIMVISPALCLPTMEKIT